MKTFGILMTFCLIFALSATSFGQRTVEPSTNKTQVPVKTDNKTVDQNDNQTDEPEVIDLNKSETTGVQEVPKNTKERYRIGFDDTLEVQVFNQEKLSGKFNVNPDGTIRLFRLEKPIVAVCKTEDELGKDIAAAYEENYLRNPYVNVRAIDQKSQSFAVIGAVGKREHFMSIAGFVCSNFSRMPADRMTMPDKD